MAIETQAFKAETQEDESSDNSDCTSTSGLSDFSVLCSADTCSSRAGDSDASEATSCLCENAPLDSPLQFSNSQLGKAAFEFSLAATEFLRSIDSNGVLCSGYWDSATSRNKCHATGSASNANSGLQALRPVASLLQAASFAADASPCKPIESGPDNATTSCSDIDELCLADQSNSLSTKRGRGFAGQLNPRPIKLVRTTGRC